MRITKLWIKEYKNLKDFTWELNPDSPVAVIVGKNASGKTNLLEAIVKIFYFFKNTNIDDKGIKNKSEQNIGFNFQIEYTITSDFDDTSKLIKIEKKYQGVTIFADEKKIDIDNSIEISKIIPKYILFYYVGIDSRIIRLMNIYNKDYLEYYTKNWKKKSLRFERDIINYDYLSQKITALSLMTSGLDYIKKNLLDNFGIESLVNIKISFSESNLFNKSNTKDIKKNMPLEVIQTYQTLLKLSLAGVYSVENTTDFLEIMDFGEHVAPEFKNQFSENNFFHQMSMLYVLGYLKDIQIRFLKNNIPITYDELSGGEQQKLAVLGAIEVFRNKQTLFLFDEPDAFAHPRWQWDFVTDMEKAIDNSVFQQVIFVTHSPIVLSSMTEPAFLIENGKIRQINNTFGNSVNETLAEMEVDYRKSEVADKLKNYIAFIQNGKSQTEEAKKLRQELELSLGKNHTELQGADDLISLYE